MATNFALPWQNSCHVMCKKFVAITWLEFWWELDEIFMRCSVGWKDLLVKWAHKHGIHSSEPPSINQVTKMYIDCVFENGMKAYCDNWWFHVSLMQVDHTVFLPEALLAYGYCHCLRLCMCVCVCLSVCQLLLVRTITRRPFKLGSPNLNQKMQNILLKVPIVFGAD